MLEKYTFDQIRGFVSNIKDLAGILAIYLFGSYSRGEAHDGSDVDILILFDSQENLRASYGAIIRAMRKHNMFIQAVCLTLDQFLRSPLLMTILREGRLMYSREGFDLYAYLEFEPFLLITLVLDSVPSGLVDRLKDMVLASGGFIVSDNCFMIPAKNSHSIFRIIREENLAFFERTVWLPRARKYKLHS